MRQKLLMGNWKMNKSYSQAVDIAQQLSYRASDFSGVETVVCPPFTSLKGVQNVFSFDNTPIKLGAQDVFWEENGAYTGFISAEMLKDLSVSYCIIGHSERRQNAGDTDEDIQKKAQALLKYGITPVICVGEPSVVHEAGNSSDFVIEQLARALSGLEGAKDLVIAYEPIWAIGSGNVAAPEFAGEVCHALRVVVEKAFGKGFADKIRVLYGGSVMAENAGAYLMQDDIDGLLVGSASLDENSFSAIAKQM